MKTTTRGGRLLRPETGRNRVELAALISVLLLSGIVLALLAGGPRLPASMPSLDQVTSVLSGSSLPVQPLVLLVVDVAWLLWLWIGASLVLELALVAAEAMCIGAQWIQVARGLVDRASFPLARRVVAAAFAVQVLSRGAAVAAAQPLSPQEVEFVAGVPDLRIVPDARMQSDLADAHTYVVAAGDTLWSIAEREYGSGAAYRTLVNANLDRRMPDGNVFTARGVIRPGWDLVVPRVRALVDEVDGEQWYTVRAGDTLSGVAATLLGDETAWRDLFELNRGAASPDGKHQLTNANMIWPGLRLRLPRPDSTLPVAAAAEPPDEPGPGVSPPVELAVAAAPIPAERTVPAEPVHAEEPRPVASSDDDETIATPLLRTPHARYPVALEPADTIIPEAETASGTTDTPVLTTAQPEFPTGPVALGGAGLIGAVGLALGARHMRRLRRLPHQPESDVVVEGGFAEAHLTAELTRAGGTGGDALDGIVARVQHVIDEYNLESASIVTVSHGRSATTVMVSANLADQTLLVDLAPVFTERLHADVETWISPDQDVAMKVAKPGALRLLPLADSAAVRPPCLVPLGVLYDRQVYHVACSRLGHVLIASLPGHGADTILTSLIATMTARRSPDRLRVWIVAQPRAVPAPMFDLPHVERAVDPTDSSALRQLLDALRTELDVRASRPLDRELVVVISELTALGEHALALELLAGRASAAQLGVSVIAATSNPEQALESPMQPHFVTRMVLRMHDEETSVGLLGVADAAFLGGGGRLLVRIEGREAVELYGYHVSNEHLERLVRLMRASFAPSLVPVIAQDSPADAESAPAADEVDPTPVTTVAESDDQASQGGATIVDASVAADAAPATATSATLPDAAIGNVTEARPVVAIAPIQITCFDGPRITCQNHVLWPRQRVTRGGDAKPWEFLLYLACQPAEGVSADEAVEALWPGGEEIDAAHRFRQLRYRLRLALASVEGAPATDGISLGRGMVRLDPGIVHSDAQEFLELVRAARVNPGPRLIEQLERARAIYTGDLLAGPDARRYTWLDERDNSGVTLREHFRRLFQQASTRLAEAYVNAGELELAMEVYRELTDVDPADDHYWIALYRVHAQRGDRIGLLREERRLRATLRALAAEEGHAGDATHEEPTRETMQEFQRLLSTLRESEPESAAV